MSSFNSKKLIVAPEPLYCTSIFIANLIIIPTPSPTAIQYYIVHVTYITVRRKAAQGTQVCLLGNIYLAT